MTDQQAQHLLVALLESGGLSQQVVHPMVP